MPTRNCTFGPFDPEGLRASAMPLLCGNRSQESSRAGLGIGAAIAIEARNHDQRVHLETAIGCKLIAIPASIPIPTPRGAAVGLSVLVQAKVTS
jgi:hypothetical protein